MNNISQTCQNESGLLKILNTGNKKNEKLNSAEDFFNCEREGNILKESNIASQMRVRLEGKFVSKNVTNISREEEISLPPEISLFSIG